MIVVASNNGYAHLETCLNALSNYLLPNTKVAVIDTYSSDLEWRKEASRLTLSYNFEFFQAPHPHYDFGGYKHIWLNTNEPWYFFMHDSLYLTNHGLEDRIIETLTAHDIAPWVSFPKNFCPFDSDTQRDWLYTLIGTHDYDDGFYGPNFAARKTTLDLLQPTLHKIVVDTKWKQQGMERGWGIISKLYNLNLGVLESGWDWAGLTNGTYTFFRKAKHIPRN